MTPWIQVYSNILTHDKTYGLAESLDVPNYAAVGLMVSLWSWASINAADGDITNYPPRAIMDAAGWKAENPEDFYKSLLDIRLIEKSKDGVFIRNWERYASTLMDKMEGQKKKTNERVKRYREKAQKAKYNSDSGHCNVTCNVTETIQNNTKPKPTKPSNINTPEDALTSFNGILRKKLSEWLQYKSERREPYKPTGLKSFITGVQNKRKDYTDQQICNLIDECMANNWKGIIWDKLKKDNPKQNKSAQTAGSSIDKNALDAYISGQFVDGGEYA